ERLGHRQDGLRHPQPIAAEVVPQLVEAHGTDLTGGVGSHRPVSWGRVGERARGARNWFGDRPAPSSLWGGGKSMPGGPRGPYRVNQRGAGGGGGRGFPRGPGGRPPPPAVPAR